MKERLAQPYPVLNSDVHFARLKWACRRGMLELDVLLNNFLTHYPKLIEFDQQNFANLLDCSDPELYAWLLGTESPPSHFSNLIQMIRTYVIK